MSRLIDADNLLKKWNSLSLRGRTEFDQVIMTEPTFEVENNLEVYTVANTEGDPNAINVFTFHVDEDGCTKYSMYDYCKFYGAAIKGLPDTVASCLLPDDMSVEVWTVDELKKMVNSIQEFINIIDRSK